MIHVFRDVIAPLLSIAIFMLGSGFFVSFQSIFLEELGYSNVIIGYVHSAYYAGMLIGTFKVEHFIHRVGHIRAMAAFATICAVIIQVQALFQDPYLWIVLRLVVGYCLAGVFVVIESWLLDKGTDQTRGQILSLYMVAFYSAQALGQFFLDIYPVQALQPFIVAAILCCCGVVPVAMMKAKSPEIQEPEVKKATKVLEESPFGFLGCVISGMMLSSMYSFGPNFAQANHISPSLTMSLLIMGGVLLQIPIGKISDIFDRRLVLLTLAALTIIPCLLIPYVLHDEFLLLSTIFILGGVSFTIYPLSLTQACDRIQPKVLTSVTAVLLMAFGIGSVIGPLASPYLMSWYGSFGLFYYVAVMSGMLVLVGAGSISFFKKIPAEDQNDFVPLPRTSPVVYDLDPRGEPLDTEDVLSAAFGLGGNIDLNNNIHEQANNRTEKTPY